MRPPLHLTITTPATVLVDRAGVLSVRAEDESGGFGILPGHTDLLTVLGASVVRWRDESTAEHFCTLRGGVMTVTGGRRVDIAAREGSIGDDLTTLEAKVEALRTTETEAERQTRVDHTRLHAHAVRQLIRLLGSGPTTTAPSPFERGATR